MPPRYIENVSSLKRLPAASNAVRPTKTESPSKLKLALKVNVPGPPCMGSGLHPVAMMPIKTVDAKKKRNVDDVAFMV